ncbi:MAG: hypothetical protein LBK82_12220 [Planctomycetaceae bacterium]|nr:hypothetical protein [Planctomycetaceae bacterium]
MTKTTKNTTTQQLTGNDLKNILKHNRSVKPNSEFIERLKKYFPQFFNANENFNSDKFTDELKSNNITKLRNSYVVMYWVLVFIILFAVGIKADETVYFPADTATPINSATSGFFGLMNPYLDLENDTVTGESGKSYAIPSGTYTDLSSAFSTKTLLAEMTDNDSAESILASTTKNAGELYLSQIPNGKRSGMFQKANFNILWAPKSGGHKGLGITQIDLSAVSALQLSTVDSTFVVTPKFQAWFFDPKTKGDATDKTLYSMGLDFRLIRPIVKNKLTLDFGVTTSYNGDFKVKPSKAMRFPARIAGIWDYNPRLKIILGVVYLDSNDYRWLPVAGMIWTPREDLSVEMIVPHLRIAQRIRWFGSAAGDDQSDWIYTGFEFGGGSWGLEYNNLSGEIDYRDLKLLLGYERRCASGVTLGLELGYMFERKYEFEHYKVYPTDGVFLRLRTTF